MATENAPQNGSSPPNGHCDVDEGYWAALLHEGECIDPAPKAHSNGNGWHKKEHPLTPPLNDGPAECTNIQDWETAQSILDQDQTIDLNVKGYNQGGLLVAWNSLRGFVPASQLVDFPVDIDDYIRRNMLSKYVGRDLTLRIIELVPELDRLILSERAAQSAPGQRADILFSLESGTTCKGTVTNLCDFGAFVDLGGIEGLIHISELSWGRVGHPRDVLSSGQEVSVHIMSIDADEGRIALSLKLLQPDPWASVEERYEIGQKVKGVVTNVVDFGAFACIEEGLEGLVHISELAEGQFLHPRNVVREGDQIEARILNIDGPARRLGLTLRNLDEEQ